MTADASHFFPVLFCKLTILFYEEQPRKAIINSLLWCQRIVERFSFYRSDRSVLLLCQLQVYRHQLKSLSYNTKRMELYMRLC